MLLLLQKSNGSVQVIIRRSAPVAVIPYKLNLNYCIHPNKCIHSEEKHYILHTKMGNAFFVWVVGLIVVFTIYVTRKRLCLAEFENFVFLWQTKSLSQLRCICDVCVRTVNKTMYFANTSDYFQMLRICLDSTHKTPRCKLSRKSLPSAWKLADFLGTIPTGCTIYSDLYDSPWYWMLMHFTILPFYHMYE